MDVHQRKVEPWRVTLVDTGDGTMTGGRLKRVADYLRNEESFCFTYGDGLSDLDISREITFHKQHGNSYRNCRTAPWPLRFAKYAGQRRDRLH